MSLHGHDISHWQSGLNVAATDGKYAIMKATDGTSYVDSQCDHFYQAAKKDGQLLGVYHFWQAGMSATAQADHFVATVRGYVGEAMLVLDWESTDTGNVSGAKAFLDRVYAKTGVRPVIYMSQSVAASHNWSSVSKDYALWVARYSDSIGSTGGWPVLMWQYTSSHKSAGYTLDADTFYGDAATWRAFATGANTPDPDPDPTPEPEDDMPEWKNLEYREPVKVKADGEWHVLTIGADDDGGILYSLLTGPVYATGVLAVTVEDLAVGHELNLRPVVVESKSGQDTKVVNQEPATEFFAESGLTAASIAFTQYVAKGEDGWAKRLRFQIRAYGGEEITVTSAHARALYWQK